VLFIVLPALLTILYGSYLIQTAPGKSDFWTFWVASRTVLHGGNPYPAITTLPHHASAWFAPFVYPPVAAFLLAPLAVLPYVVAKVLFVAFNLLAVGGALRLLRVRDWRCYSLAFSSPAILEAMGIGTISIALLLVVAAAWRYRERVVACGLLIACAITAKLFLWPLWFWLVRTRRYRAAAIAVVAALGATAASWAAIGFAGLRGYPTLLARMTGLEGPHGYSVYALERAIGIGDGPAGRGAYVVGLTALFVALRFVRDDRRLLAAMLGVAFLATPILWPHYLVLLFVPLAVTTPSFSPLWFAPVALWADAESWSHGTLLRIGGQLAFSAVVIGAAVHRSLPPGQRVAVGTTRLRSSERLQPTGATGSAA
jgi:alpha-1,2-mannosyltransferase